MTCRFRQADVLSAVALEGRPLAVVHAAPALASAAPAAGPGPSAMGPWASGGRCAL